MYCTVEDMRRLLPEKVSIGDANLGAPVPGRQGSKRSNISPDEALHYIGYAQQYVDSRLRPYYVCPLRRIISFEVDIESAIINGVDIAVSVRDSNNFGIGQFVRLKGKHDYEETVVKSVPDFKTVILESVSNDYMEGTISILEYPDPIPLITSRMACSYVLDRLFSSEQSPDVSNYGKTQRNLARSDLEDILVGEILLFGQEHTGYRFVRGSVHNAYKSPAEIQKGTERE